jgi:hypothetical protein
MSHNAEFWPDFRQKQAKLLSKLAKVIIKYQTFSTEAQVKKLKLLKGRTLIPAAECFRRI